MSRISSEERSASFRRRFAARDLLLGTFIKTPSPHVVEIVGSVGFDFLILDAEHAPFDRGDVDRALLAAAAAGTPTLVRVAALEEVQILSALDCGAGGVLVPHVRGVADARRAVAASRYRGGRRGFSAAGRAGGYGGSAMWRHVDAQDAAVTVVAMIEDPEALDEVAAIAATEGIGGLFVGRADLAVAMGAESAAAPEVMQAVREVANAARQAGKPVCLMPDGRVEAEALFAAGVSAFVLGSDQAMLRAAAMAAVAGFASLAGPAPSAQSSSD